MCLAFFENEDTTTYVYNYNTANELTKQTVGGTHTTFAYDAWGKQIGDRHLF